MTRKDEIIVHLESEVIEPNDFWFHLKGILRAINPWRKR